MIETTGVGGGAQAREPTLVQALIPKLPVEALDKRILHRLAWIDEVQRHAIPVGPLIHDLTDELRSVSISKV